MENRIGIAVGLIVGFVLGAISVHSLHAQGKPLVYLINEIDVTDPEGYGKEFAPKAQATVTAKRGPLMPRYSPTASGTCATG